MVKLLNSYFVPLYVENEEAEEILHQAGKKAYQGKEWELVQTHVILPSGELHELWRPGHNTGGEDPQNLENALQTAVKNFELQEHSVLPNTHSMLPEDPNGMVMEVVLRFPFQDNFQRIHAYTIDWIQLSQADLKELSPRVGVRFPYSISSGLAAKILIHFRIPLDDAQDPDELAMKLVKTASLQGVASKQENGHRFIQLQGEINLASSKPVAETEDDKWSQIIKGNIQVHGYVELDEQNKVLDVHLITQQASFLPPNRKEIQYDGMARKFAEKE